LLAIVPPLSHPAIGAQVDVDPDPDSELPPEEVEAEMDTTFAAQMPDSVVATGPFVRRHALLFEVLAESGAFYGGGTYRFRFLADFGTGIFFSGDVRVDEQAVREQIRTHYYIQRQESRWFLALGVEQLIRLGPLLDVFLQAGPAYTWADYDGSEVNPEEGFLFLGRAGISLRFNTSKKGSLLFRAGYQYADLRTNGPSFFYGAVGGEF
jgi:hypothetical protein